MPTAARFDPPSGLEGIAVIPAEEVSTERAREAIPAEVPLADAVANVSAASRLVLGLQTADLDLVAARPRRPHPPAPPPRALPALDGAGRRRHRAGRPRRDDLRRRPHGSRLDHLAGRRQGRRGAGAAAALAGPRSAASPSAPTAPTSPSCRAQPSTAASWAIKGESLVRYGLESACDSRGMRRTGSGESAARWRMRNELSRIRRGSIEIVEGSPDTPVRFGACGCGWSLPLTNPT